MKDWTRTVVAVQEFDGKKPNEQDETVFCIAAIKKVMTNSLNLFWLTRKFSQKYLKNPILLQFYFKVVKFADNNALLKQITSWNELSYHAS